MWTVPVSLLINAIQTRVDRVPYFTANPWHLSIVFKLVCESQLCRSRLPSGPLQGITKVFILTTNKAFQGWLVGRLCFSAALQTKVKRVIHAKRGRNPPPVCFAVWSASLLSHHFIELVSGHLAFMTGCISNTSGLMRFRYGLRVGYFNLLGFLLVLYLSLLFYHCISSKVSVNKHRDGGMDG